MGALRDFFSQVEPEILDGFQHIAARKGRELQALIEEALREYLARKRQQLANNKSVVEASRQSVDERDELYRSLAK